MRFFQYRKSSYKQTLQLSSKLEILICIFLSIYAVIRKIVHNNISKKFLYSLYVQQLVYISLNLNCFKNYNIMPMSIVNV